MKQMTNASIQELAEQLISGELTLDRFVDAVSSARTAELGDVSLDLDRRQRCGFPEVIFGEGKSVATLEKIFHCLLAEGSSVLATRISLEKAKPLCGTFPAAQYNDVARTFRIAVQPNKPIGKVAVITAGTSDLPVAEEARETLDWMEVSTTMVHDVGVAGPHRLPARLEEFQDSDAIVVVAGLEGALPSIVGGYVACPVVAVPTSVGYGASFGGVAALLGMLNSCASNVVVVNIDAGFKAAYVAGLIAHNKHK